MLQQLVDRVALVTGASSGLGARFAAVLAEAGATVVLAARRTDRLAAEVARIRAAGGRAEVLTLDVAQVESIGPALDEVEARFGPISILVNNAGVGGEGMALELSIESFDETYAVNVRGVFFAAREAARRMIASGEAAAGRARIINIASILAETTLPGVSAYCASKAAVAMLTKALAREWASDQIAVNAICPGYIATDINAAWLASEGGRRHVSRLPRRRVLDPSDLDAALLMLAGPAAHAITGSLLTVDDGQSL